MCVSVCKHDSWFCQQILTNFTGWTVYRIIIDMDRSVSVFHQVKGFFSLSEGMRSKYSALLITSVTSAAMLQRDWRLVLSRINERHWSEFAATVDFSASVARVWRYINLIITIIIITNGHSAVRKQSVAVVKTRRVFSSLSAVCALQPVPF